MAVLPYSRAGISGAAMLGLGRAIGETIAVTLVIGNAPDDRQARSSTRATRWPPSSPTSSARRPPTRSHRAALIAAGLVLFVLTLVVNAHRPLLRQPRRARPARRVPQGMAGMSADAVAPSRRSARRRRRTDAVARGLVARADARRARPARAWSSTTCSRRASAPGAGLLHHRPDRPLPRRPGRHQRAILGHDRDGRAGQRHRRSRSASASRSTSSSTARTVALRQRRPLLRRRDDRRAVDRLRPVHLHHARR